MASNQIPSKGAVNLEKIGIFQDDKGIFINPNIYARHLDKSLNIVQKDFSTYYQYKDDYYHKLEELELLSFLRDYFNMLVPDGWTLSLENQYFPAFEREVTRAESLVQSDNYINTKNGLLFIEDSIKYLPHTKRIFTTSQIPVMLNKGQAQECPRFMTFLDEVFLSNQDLILLVQEILGYALSNSTKAHKLFLFFGRGRNGKSLLLNILTELVGIENVSNISLQGFSNPFEVANIVNKKINVSTENSFKGRQLRTDLLKSISAGDATLIKCQERKAFFP